MPDVLATREAASRRRRRMVVTAIVPLVLSACGRGDASTAGPPAPPRFADEAGSSGIAHRYTGDFSFFVGGGVAAFDCTGDGKDELYLAGGSSPAGLYRNDSEVAGALRFTHMPSPVTDLADVTGAYPLDVDSDGVTDLAVLRNGPNFVLRGLGDCRFEDATERLGIDPGDQWTTAFSATWEGANALPTLAFGTYLGPDEQTCGDSALFRPSGGRYGTPITLAPGYCTLSMLFSDWSRSGRRDLRVANDRHYYTDGSEQLWRIAPGEPPQPYGEQDGWIPLRIWGMGIASLDLTGDGYPEVFLTSQGDNKLQTLVAGPSRPAYQDMALRRGVTAQRPYTGGDVLPSTAWHPQFDDVNNDGWPDLFISKGNVEGQTDHAMKDPSNLLIGQPDGAFVEGAVEAGIVGFDKARGAALSDLNLDGLLDLVVVHREADMGVFRNVGSGDAAEPDTMGHWLAVRLRQPAPNPDAVGAWLEVRAGDRTFLREITVGGGHVSGQIGWRHVGLGAVEGAEVRVTWPDGAVGPWMDVDADSFYEIERGAAEAVPWSPEG